MARSKQEPAKSQGDIMKRKEANALAFIIVVIIPAMIILSIVISITKEIGLVFSISIIFIALVGYFVFKTQNQKRRFSGLVGKYGSEEIAKNIIDGRFWQGQTSEQLLESLGRPVEIEDKVLKSKSRQLWKYKKQGVNRFGLRITVENGYVTGWEQK